MPIRYSPDSIVVPSDPAEILEWAACHIEHVGIHQGNHLFNGPGRTVTLACWPRGAIRVAAGDGRFTSQRRYDHAAIRRGEAEALRLFAEHLTGHPINADEDPYAYRRAIDTWSAAPGRTAQETAEQMRAAVRQAQAATARAERLF
ncbi:MULTISPECIES: DUF6197 family protein [Streptacidiphilus]|uniref:DUF6197 family protein n=1 Tax=Streptacidiphilus cavernicola TaxID=3342716 RepID=A0ABV6UP07_9ACTN|nr:DUF6197 family protein [Streptacidiphilus jeojiense]